MSVQDSMVDMFKEAEEKKLWFFSQYQQIWLSPDELRKYQENRRFRWGPVNWQLRDPQEYLDQLDKEIKHLQEKRELIREKIAASQN